jgi:Putative peptidoglycan binding domain
MATSLLTITFVVGLALVVIAVLGGGIEVKELKVPQLGLVPRIATFLLGCGLIVLCMINPQMFPDKQNANPVGENKVADKTNDLRNTDVCSQNTDWLGQAIRDHLITIQQVKLVLRHLGRYAGEIDDKTDCQYKRAVVEFQLSQSLDPDSYVGPATYRKLREAWPDFFNEGKTPASLVIP